MAVHQRGFGEPKPRFFRLLAGMGVGLMISGTANAVPASCLDRFMEHLKLCQPLSCQMNDPRLPNDPITLQIIGRQEGSCGAQGMGGPIGLRCALSPHSVAYVRRPSTREALESKDLRIQPRAPATTDEAMGLLQGRPLVEITSQGKTVDSSFISRECQLTR